MFISVGTPGAPEAAAAARRSRPGAEAPLGPHRRTPPPPCSGSSASARRAGSPTAAASRRAEESWRRPLPRLDPFNWRAPGAPAHLSRERSAACRPRGHCARAAPPARVPRPPLTSRASRAAEPSLPVAPRGPRPGAVFPATLCGPQAQELENVCSALLISVEGSPPWGPWTCPGELLIISTAVVEPKPGCQAPCG